MNMENDMKKEDEISLSDMIVMFIKKKWWFIGTILTVLAIGLVYVFFQPVSYLLTYQIEMKEDYSNMYLNGLYSNREEDSGNLPLQYSKYVEDLNYMSLQTIPVIFKSNEVFKSVKDIDEEIDYRKLLKSDSVKIDLIKDTSIFSISVSSSDYELANNIAKTLIAALENTINDRQEMILNEIRGIINADIKDLKDENISLQNTIVNELEKELVILYEKLDKYIVDYNIDIFNRLGENRSSDNISFYNIIIPPSNIDNEILILQKEIEIYEERVMENKLKIIDMSNLNEKLINDEDMITERIRLISDSLSYEVEDNKLRNIAIVIVLSIILGIMMTFVVNFIQNSKIKEKIGKK